MPRFSGHTIRSSRFGAALAALVLLAVMGLARYGTYSVDALWQPQTGHQAYFDALEVREIGGTGE